MNKTLMKPTTITTILVKPSLLATALLSGSMLFYLNYRLMATLPGTRNFQCIIGAYLTPFNITFALILSAFGGWIVAAFIALVRQKRDLNAAGAASFMGIGALIGTLTSFCTLCTLPAITFFGASLSLYFFTDYNIIFKGASLLLMLASLFWLNRQLKLTCNICIK